MNQEFYYRNDAKVNNLAEKFKTIVESKKGVISASGNTISYTGGANRTTLTIPVGFYRSSTSNPVIKR